MVHLPLNAGVAPRRPDLAAGPSRFSSGPAAEERKEVAGQGVGVVSCAVDVGGGPRAEHRQAEDVEAGGLGDHAAVVADAPAAVAHRDVEPGVVGPEARCPQDGSDLPAASGPVPAGCGDRRKWARSGVVAGVRRPSPDVAAHSSARFRNRFIFRSARAQVLGSDPENWATPIDYAAEAADDADPLRRERVEVGHGGFGGAGELRRGQVAGPGQVVDLGHGVRPAGRWPPATRRCRGRGSCAVAGRVRLRPESPAVPTGGSRRRAGRQWPTRRRREPRRRGAGRGRGSVSGVSVEIDGGTASAMRRDRWRGCTPRWPGPRPCAPEAASSSARISKPCGPARTVTRRVGADRCADRDGRSGSRVVDDLGGGHESVGVIAGVVVAGQPGLPVRGEQPQESPALGPPRVRHLTALEDDVVDRAFGEAAAHGQAGMAGPDDDGRGPHHSHASVSWSVRPARRGPWSGWS